MWVINHGDLGAGVSELGKPESPPDVATILGYEGVVESFFSRRTIIPMRYGCTVRDRSELTAVLDQHHEPYDALLQRLEGLAEMGIQVTADGLEGGPEIDTTAVLPAGAQDSHQLGVSYLSAKKLYYDTVDRTARRQERAGADALPAAVRLVRPAQGGTAFQ